MKVSNIDSVLAQMRVMSAKMEEATQKMNPVAEPKGSEFTNMLASAINQVNSVQQTSAASQNAFERGEDISLSEVMINVQKAKVAFTGMVEVRNKMISVYQDIMNMPV